jgi:hypothetical protein
MVRRLIVAGEINFAPTNIAHTFEDEVFEGAGEMNFAPTNMAHAFEDEAFGWWRAK